MEAAVRAYQNVTQKEFRDTLVVDHLECVRHILGRMASTLPAFVDLENLEAAGILGLVEAAGHFDSSREIEFRTYATHRIRGAILDELRRNCPLPQQILQQWGKIRQIWEELGHQAPHALVAERAGLSEEEFEECLAAVRLAQPEVWHDELRVKRQSGREDHDPQTQFDEADQQQLLTAAIEQLPDRLRVVLSLYYTENLRLAEIAVVLGLSESRCSRLLAKAQLQLKSTIERDLNHSLR